MSERLRAPAERVAALRILIGAYALVYLLVRLSHVLRAATFAPRQFAPVGPVHLLTQPLPWVVVLVIALVAVAAGVAYVLGWRHRVTGPLFAFTLLWTLSYRNSWSMIFHTENLLVLHVLVLGLVPSADAWSLDARRRPPSEGARFEYGWPILLLCAVTVTTYFIAGYTKLVVAGWAWITEDALRYHVAHDNLRKLELGSIHSVLGTWLAGHAGVFRPLAAASVAVEILAPLALLTRRAGHVWSVVAWGFHFGVFALMAIGFHHPLSFVAFMPFFDAAAVLRWARRRVPWLANALDRHAATPTG
jgi:hypothetical protein